MKQLNEEEKEYYKQAFQTAARTESELKQAEANFNLANAHFLGFVKYMGIKYKLSDKMVFTRDGEIVEKANG